MAEGKPWRTVKQKAGRWLRTKGARESWDDTKCSFSAYTVTEFCAAMCDFCSTRRVWGLGVVMHVNFFLKNETSVNLMSASLQSKKKADETGCEQVRAGESIVCPSVFISRWDQVHLSCGICNEPLVSVSDVPARPSCWFVQQTWVQKGRTEKQKRSLSVR